MTSTAYGEPARKSRQRLTRRLLIVWTGHRGWIVAPFIEWQMLFGFVKRQSQLTVAGRWNQAGAAIAQIVIVIVVRRDVVVLMILRRTPAVLRADCTPCWRRMFQLLVRFAQWLRMIDGRCVAGDQMIIIDAVVDVQDLRTIEACLLIVVHRIQVVRVLTLRQRDDTVTRLARHRLRIEWVVGGWNTVGARQRIFPWNGLLFICKEKRENEALMKHFRFHDQIISHSPAALRDNNEPSRKTLNAKTEIISLSQRGPFLGPSNFPFRFVFIAHKRKWRISEIFAWRFNYLK